MNALTLDPSAAISFDMSDQFPVTVAVTRPDGSVEQVRIGTATKSADGFSISMGQLSIGSTPAPRAAAGAARPAGGGGGGDGMVFPPYGRSKGMPVRGGSMQDLEYSPTGASGRSTIPARAGGTTRNACSSRRSKQRLHGRAAAVAVGAVGRKSRLLRATKTRRSEMGGAEERTP